MHWIVHDGGGKCIKTQETSHLTVGILYHKSVSGVLLGVEPVLHLPLVPDRAEVKLLQVPAEQLVHYWNVLLFRWS